MIFPIILCFFGFAHGLQFYANYGGSAALPLLGVSQIGLNSAYGSGSLAVIANRNQAYNQGSNPLRYGSHLQLNSQYLPLNSNYFYVAQPGGYAQRYYQEYQAPVTAAVINTGTLNEAPSVPQLIEVQPVSNPADYNLRSFKGSGPVRVAQSQNTGGYIPAQQSQIIEIEQNGVKQWFKPAYQFVKDIVVSPIKLIGQEPQPVEDNSPSFIAREQGPRQESQNVGAIQSNVAAGQSVQDLQAVNQNENRQLSNIDQQLGSNIVQIPIIPPTNVEVRGQGVGQSVGEVNNVQQQPHQQQVGLVQIEVPNSYQQLIGYSQQLHPVVASAQYARNIDASNVGLVPQFSFNNGNGFASSGIVAALAAGGRSAVVKK